MCDALNFSDQRAAVLRACGYAAADEVSFHTRRNQNPNALTTSAGVRGELTADAGNVILRVLFPLVEVEDSTVRCVACEGFAKSAELLRHLLRLNAKHARRGHRRVG